MDRPSLGLSHAQHSCLGARSRELQHGMQLGDGHALSRAEGRALPVSAVTLTESHREGDAHDDARERHGDPRNNELMTAKLDHVSDGAHFAEMARTGDESNSQTEALPQTLSS